MNAVARNLRQVWDQLRGQMTGREEHLEEVLIRNLRGIDGLRVPFRFPVTVLAGPNGGGKSTVLMACACAYADATHGVRALTPATLFPCFRHPQHGVGDRPADATIEFSYIAGGCRQQMVYHRGGAKWNRSFKGRAGAVQPRRRVFIRTLANLANPSEIRAYLQMGRKPCDLAEIDAASIAFAQRILSFRYQRLSVITSGVRALLFAQRSDAGSGCAYSEFHMSAGERSILHLSVELSRLTDALVLIDEVEAGLHPQVQELLMLELQRLALRNRLQVIVTTHSPVVLDTVPAEARVFLERTDGGVVRREAFRDVIQRSLYGRPLQALSVLCEDAVGEAIIRGILDALAPAIDLTQGDIDIGRDSGKDEFLHHLETLARFRRLDQTVFVLDGDGAPLQQRLEARALELGQALCVLVLPDPGAIPEQWLWDRLATHPEDYAGFLGLSPEALRQRLAETDVLYAGAADTPTAKRKHALHSVLEASSRTVEELARTVARHEAERRRGRIVETMHRLQDAIHRWRSTP